MTEQGPAKSSSLIRHSEILRHAVIDSNTLDKLGRVEVLWMFPQINRVLGLVVKPGLFGVNRLVFKLPQVQSVKAQVLVKGDAEETTLDKVKKLESLLGKGVWTEAGDRIGTITDCLFDLSSGVIIRYLIVPDGQLPKLIAQFADGIYLLSPKQIKSFSQQRVLIADESVDQLKPYSEGIRLKLAAMTATLKHEYWDGATDEWRSMAQHVQSIAHKATDHVLSLAEKAQSLSKTFAQKVSTTVTDQVDQVENAIADQDQPWNDPEWVEMLTDTVKDKGKSIVSNVKDRSQPVIERLKTVQETLQTSVADNLTPEAHHTEQSPSDNVHAHHSNRETRNDSEALECEGQWHDHALSDAAWIDDDMPSKEATLDHRPDSDENSDAAENLYSNESCDSALDSPDPWDDWDDSDEEENREVFKSASPAPSNPPAKESASGKASTHQVPDNYEDPWDT